MQPPNIVAALTDVLRVGPPVAHRVFDPTPRDAHVSERAIVELMELADDAAHEPFIGQPPDFVAEEAHVRTRARASAGRKLST